MNRTRLITVFSLVCTVLFLMYSCKGTYKVIETNSRNAVVNSDFSTEDSLYALVAPYKKELGDKMDEVLNTSLDNMEIGSPEGLLGNFICDLVLSNVKKKYLDDIDFCLLNNGGLRVPILKGDVTRGMIYELMPFENEMWVLELDGIAMNELIGHIADVCIGNHSSKQGVAVSGVRIRMGGGAVNEVRVGINIYDEDKTYKVLTSDYLAKGGDGMSFFEKAKGVEKLNVKLRDVILDEVIELGENGIKLNAQLDGRVYIAE